MLNFSEFIIRKFRIEGFHFFEKILQSEIFRFYDTTVAYPNYWILFYLLSLFLILKKWPISPFSYILATTSKALSAFFFPVTLLFIYRTDFPKRKKILILISYGLIVVFAALFIYITGSNVGPSEVANTDFNFNDFLMGLTAVNAALRLDGLVLVFLLPLTIGLFFASRNGIYQSDSILLMILIMLLSAPILEAFSDHHSVPYRFIPLIVFFAIGVGLLFSRKPNQLSE